MPLLRKRRRLHAEKRYLSPIRYEELLDSSSLQHFRPAPSRRASNMKVRITELNRCACCSSRSRHMKVAALLQFCPHAPVLARAARNSVEEISHLNKKRIRLIRYEAAPCIL